MIFETDVKYSKVKLNLFDVRYRGYLIGTVKHTPKGPGTWTFKSTREKVETYGSTKAQAVRFYIEKFMEGERNQIQPEKLLQHQNRTS